ncbi:MAG: hypothetical protein Q7U58_06670, partial [Hydrogenophaga sp.]|nr:hypothetical protein [Hydrogenophaga sp.]
MEVLLMVNLHGVRPVCRAGKALCLLVQSWVASCAWAWGRSGSALGLRGLLRAQFGANVFAVRDV